MLSLLAIVAALWLCTVFALNGLLNYALKPDMKDGGKENLSWQSAFKNHPFLKPWHDSLVSNKSLKDTFIYSTVDGSRLHAFFIKAPRKTDSTAIVIHGYTDNAINMMMIGFMYNHEFQYNVIIPNLRCSGKTAGNYVQMGWRDSRDVLDWLHFTDKTFGRDGFKVLHGISMGAATAMMTSRFVETDKSVNNIGAYIEDCGYTSVYDQFAKELKGQFGLPAYPILDMASNLNKLLRSWSFKEASSLNCVKGCFTPMMFIHGDSDTYVPTEMAYELFKVKPTRKELWIVKGATHAQSYKINPQEYTKRVHSFLGRAAQRQISLMMEKPYVYKRAF